MGTFELSQALILVGAAVVFVYAAARDIQNFTIPNACTLLLFALFVPFALARAYGPEVTGNLATAGTVFAVTFLLYLTRHFGAGDVKLMSAAALWAGPGLIADFIVVTSLSGAALAMISLAGARVVAATAGANAYVGADSTSHCKIPYGVAIAAGGLVVLWHLM